MSFLSKKKSSSSSSHGHHGPTSPGGSSSHAPSSPGFAPRQCPFKKFGCMNYLNTKVEYEVHLRDDMQTHLMLVVEKFDHQFDLHTQLMAHFTEQMEDQLDRTMKVVKNHMDSFGTQLQGRVDEGIDKCMTFAKKVEQQQQQLAKRLITQQNMKSPPVGQPKHDDGADATLSSKQIEAELTALQQRIKKDMADMTEDAVIKLERKFERSISKIDKIELDVNANVDKKTMLSTLDDTLAHRAEAIETSIVKRIEEKDKKRADQSSQSFDTKLDALRDKIKTIETQCLDMSGDLRKVKLEHSNNLSAAPSRSSVTMPAAPAFNKSEVLDELKKMEQQFNDKLAKSENKTSDDLKNVSTEISELQRKLKQHGTEVSDVKQQMNKQSFKVKQIEDDLKKSDSLLMLVQNNVKKHNEFFEKEREREQERQRIQESVKRLEANQKKLEAEIAEGNEQVERVLREETSGSSVSSLSSPTPSPSNQRSPLPSKRSSVVLSSPVSISAQPAHTPAKTIELASHPSSSNKESSSNAGSNSANNSASNSANNSHTKETSSSSASANVVSSSSAGNEDGENGILWEYDPVVEKWIRLSIKLKVDRKPFAEGALRQAYHTTSLGVSDNLPALGPKHTFPTVDSISTMTSRNEAVSQLKAGTKFVLKLYKKEAEQQTSRELYFEDVKMQLVCRDWGHRFNHMNPPKKIEFLMSWVVELVDRGSTPVLCSIEPLLVGEFKKNNSNYGAVLNSRSTPQAFSHFTYENSNKQMIIVDIQGVDDLYTDPQIHTADGKGFGLGNLGKVGINKFITTHKCNAVCALLDLDVKLNGSGNNATMRNQQLKGTMVLPDIVSELQLASPSDVKIGANELSKLDMSRKELKCINTVQSFRKIFNCIYFFEGTRYLCAGYGDGVMRVFDIENNWNVAHTIYAHRKPVVSVCSNSQYIFTSSPDQTVKVHSLKNTSKALETFIGHTGEVSCIRANEKYLFSGSYDKTIKVWDLSTFREVKALEGHTKYIKCLALSGRYLFSAGNDQTIYVWDTESLTCLYGMQGHEDWVLSLHVCGAHLFSTSKDNVIKIWDLSDFHCVETLRGHWNSVSSCVVNDRLLYSGSEDNSIKVWDLDTLECVYTQNKSHSLGIRSVTYCGNQLITTSYDGSIKVWEWITK